MLATDRVVLVDLENVVGFRPKQRTLRTRMTALLAAVGAHHHVVAAYTVGDADDDVTASTLAALGVAPLRVQPGVDAAEFALLAHARRMQADGCARFTVCSGDHAFAALADAEVVHVDILVWQGQPVSKKLAAVADSVRRLPRPGEPITENQTVMTNSQTVRIWRSTAQFASMSKLLTHLTTGILTGVGIALGQRLGNLLVGGSSSYNQPGEPRAWRPSEDADS